MTLEPTFQKKYQYVNIGADDRMQKITDDMQVCFITTTQYQFLISDIYARYIADTHKIKPLVLYRKYDNFDISRFNTEGKYVIIPYTLKRSNIFEQCIFALKCGYLFKFTSWNNILDKDKASILFIYNDMSKLTQRMIDYVKKCNSRNKVVLIEEGNTTYSETLTIRNETLWNLKHRLSKILFGIGRTSKVVGESAFIDYAIVKYTEKYRALAKAKNQTVIQQNPDILMCARQFYSNYSDASTENLNCDILYLGQPYYKDGKYFRDEDECIASIFSALPEKYKILIKPHPRDSAGKYRNIESSYKNVSIVSNETASIPVEALMEITKAKVVITIQSSAAITLANLFCDIGVIVLREIPVARHLLKRLEESGEELPKIGGDFFTSRYDNVYIPQSAEEYVRTAENLLSLHVEKLEAVKDINLSFPEIDCLF